MIYMYFQKNKLIIDKAKEHHIIFKDLKNLLEKEETSGAYNEIVFEDLVEKEVSRAQRYKYVFSILAFNAQSEILENLNRKLIRKSDYFGKIDTHTYAVLLTHSNVNEATIFANKFANDINHVAIAQYTTGDNKVMLYEKLYDALNQKNADRISIEV